jgi:hypothetical protein
MQFQLAPGTNQEDYRRVLKECGGDAKQGGYFLFGPLILLAPVVAVVEGVKYNQRGGIQKCMEAKGFKCIANCPDSSSDKLSEVPQKPVDPQLLDKWTQTIRADQEREWILYTKNPQGSIFYYDPSSLSAEDQRYVYFREQVKFSPDRAGNLSYVWRSVKVNCIDKIFKLSDFVALDKAGDTTDPRISETGWRNLPEGYPLGSFIYKKCEEETTQGTKGDVRRAPSLKQDM